MDIADNALTVRIIKGTPEGKAMDVRNGWLADIAAWNVCDHNFLMGLVKLRGEQLLRLFVAHFIGIVLAGSLLTLFAGSGLEHATILVLAGLAGSSPWIAVTCLIVWVLADKIEEHIYLFCVVGPVLVVGSWWLIGLSDLGLRDMLAFVAISSIFSSIYFLWATIWKKHRRSEDL